MNTVLFNLIYQLLQRAPGFIHEYFMKRCKQAIQWAIQEDYFEDKVPWMESFMQTMLSKY